MRQRSRVLRVLALSTVLVLFAAACSDDDEGSSDDTTADTTADTTGDTTATTAAGGAIGASVDGVLALGSVMPLTGDLQDYGPGMEAAVALAVDDINAAGGVLGADVTLVSEDSGTDPGIAGPATDKLVNSENVDAILGAAGSTVTIQGVLPITTPNGRMACSGSATSPEISVYEDEGLFIRTAPSDQFQSKLLADNITSEGYGSVAIVNRADDYGQAFADLTEQELTDAGAEVVAKVAVDPEGTNFDADVSEVISSSPDAVVLILFPEEGATVLSAMIEQGAGPADIPIYTTDGLASDDLGAAVDEANPSVVDGIQGTRPGATEEPTEFNDRLAAEKDVSEVTFAAQFYDCTVTLALAAEAAGTDDPVEMAKVVQEVTSGGEKCTDFAACKELLDAGEDIDYDGITGFDLDENGEPTQGVYEVWEFVDGVMSSLDTVTVTTS